MVLLMSAKLSVFLYFVIQILIRVASEHRARLGSSRTLATDEQRQELNHEEVVIKEAVTNLDSDGPRSNFPLGLLRVRLLFYINIPMQDLAPYHLRFKPGHKPYSNLDSNGSPNPNNEPLP